MTDEKNAGNVQLLSQLLQLAAKSTPESIAIETESGSINFVQLYQRSRQIASMLIDDGVSPGDRIGIMMDKSIESVAAIYATLLVGAAYVPLDTTSPLKRLNFVLCDAGVTRLFVDSRNYDRVRSEGDVGWPIEQYFLLDFRDSCDVTVDQEKENVVEWSAIQLKDPLRSPIIIPPDELAYVLYTSGSTSNPKGVMISHCNAMAFIDWAFESVQAQSTDRFSSHAPFHFDLSIFDLFVSCKSHSTLVLVPPSISYFPLALAKWIEEHRISIWYSVPSILSRMLAAGGLDRFSLDELRCIIFAGEVFASRDLRQWMLQRPNIRYLNYYGPTETNVCTYYEVVNPPEVETPVPIGSASSGDQIYLVHDGKVLAKDEPVVGEIWVSGPTVALGYLGDAQATLARFSPARDVTGNDLPVYRTGDLGIWNGDGEIEFRGRCDHMVKCRGYRVELGEIESALLSSEDVGEACVVATECERHGTHLTAMIASSNGTLHKEDVIAHLKLLIPHYMIPQDFEVLDELPKTVRGKIDRRSLKVQIENREKLELGK